MAMEARCKHVSITLQNLRMYNLEACCKRLQKHPGDAKTTFGSVIRKAAHRIG